MGAQLDDPNREAVGLAPIWTGSGAPPEGEGQSAPKAPKAPRHAAAEPAPAPSEDHAPGVT